MRHSVDQPAFTGWFFSCLTICISAYVGLSVDHDQRAIALCEMAKEGGWPGIWDKDIARLEKKAAARKSRA